MNTVISFGGDCSLTKIRRAVGRVTFHSKGPMVGQYVSHICAIFLYKLSISIIISGDIALEIFMRTEQLYVLSHDRSRRRGWVPVTPV